VPPRTKGLSADSARWRMLTRMEAVLGLAALVVALLVFVGANVVAVALMIGGRQAEPAPRELRH
jgi:hypothetical protein